MQIRRFALDLLLGLVALLALVVPCAQLGAAAYMAATESDLSRRHKQVCNVEGNLCSITSGRAAHQEFGRLLPGH